MKKISLFLIVCVSTLTALSQSRNSKIIKDVFGTRAFIENKGQFDQAITNGEQVKFGYETSGERIYFTGKGLVYKLIKRHPWTEHEMEQLEKGKKIAPHPSEIHYVNMNWVGANPDIQVIESGKNSNYFTYGGPELNSYTYKKITYKNVYDNIDIEYTIPEDKEYGIEYNVILRPGADPSKIKIAYTGDVYKIVKRGNNIVIKTPLEDITEHAPVSYYEDKGSLASDFSVEGNLITFNFPEGFDKTKTVIIDPFVATLTTLTSNNYAYDVDYDGVGNLFVYGGMNDIKVVKYDPNGNILWTFPGVIGGISWATQGQGNTYIGNFIVNKINGKTYIGQGFEPNPGSRVVRLDALGNYDNFVTTVVPEFRELWDMGFHCASGNVYGLGGTTASNISAGLIDQITGNMTTANFTGLNSWGQDVVSNAIDDLGNVFIIFGSNGTPSANNRILRINNGFNGNVWMQPSTFTTWQEANNKPGYIGGGGLLSNGFNCLAVNSTYLYYYDGLNLAAYNKNTGVILGSTTVPGNVVRRYGGIACDDCNNIYLGGSNSILGYFFNGTSFSTMTNINANAPSNQKDIYDIKLDRNNKLLYVCGSGFAGIYNAANSMTCGTANAFTNNAICNGFNNGQAVASVTTALANPTINYVWTNQGGTVAITLGTNQLTNTVNLPNGTYTVNIQINAPCGPSYVNTVNINCCPAVLLSPTITQAGCTSTINTATITLSGGGTLTPTSVTWSPAPGSVGPNSLTASGLPIGTNTVTVNYGGGCLFVTTLQALPAPPAITFTINNLSGTNTITCLTPTINLAIVSNYTYGTLTYSWTSISFTANTASVAITAANTLTVYVTDLATGCTATQVVAIGINTAVPTNSVNPPSQAVTCNSGAPVTFSGTVTNPTVNIQHDWYSPLNPLPLGVPIATSNNTLTILTGDLSPGPYTLVTTNLVNGCKAYQTVTVTSLSAWPTFNIASTTNFSLGCNPLNCTTLSIINPVSTQTPPATCSYTFLAPSFTGVVTPSIQLGTSTSSVICIPGTYTVIVQDNSNFCRTTISIPILQNTVAPNVSATVTPFTYTLNCYTPTVLAQGLTSTPNTTINWIVPSVPPFVSQPTIVIGDPQNGPPTGTTSLTYANFTVVATNSLNACQSTSVVVVSQNFKAPISSPTISIATPTAIYCTVAKAPVVLTTGSSTTTSGGGPTAFVANPCWSGPSPQTSTCGPSSYSCYVPGIYTLTIMDNYNGCVTSGTVMVLDRTQPPVVTNSYAPALLDCGSSQATLAIALTGTMTGGVRYLIIDYPFGASFSPSNAIISNANPILSGTSSQSINVDKLGEYLYVVTNTLTGCLANGYFNVVNGGLTASFSAEPETGYPPLDVTFTNLSASTGGSQSVTSVWSFGNGISQTTSVTNVFSTYPSPGNYTVMLISKKGACVDTAYKTIKVEIPSKLDIPNIFTPNGDGSNDVFFCKTANLGDITCVVFDRWGNKVYETTSATGNIAWDGKNFKGKECSAGVYLYIITGKGNDGKEYKNKGNVTLIR
jgi:gliding motility-associated-like protein